MAVMWKIQQGNLVAVQKGKLAQEAQIEDWVANDPSILGLDVLIFGRQVSTAHGGRIDLLGLNRDGDVMIIELKRDKTPREVVAQALDYASWVRNLTAKDIYDIAIGYLGTPLALAYNDHFSRPLPETLNANHGMLIIASELDPSSRRIVEYLNEEYRMNINTAFFNIFNDGQQEYLTADWLIDQQEATERADERTKAPWTGVWYVNVGEGAHRNWEDCLKYGFLAAGGGRVYSRPLERLSPGDKIYAYQKGAGYVGYGVVERAEVMAKDFQVKGKPLLSLPLHANMARLGEPEEDAEHVVAVKWVKTFPIKEAKTFKGMFANQNIVCKLRDEQTIEFLKREFS